MDQLWKELKADLAANRRFKNIAEGHITPNATEELKIDGFRALAHIHHGQGELVSRNGNVFRRFADLATWIAEHFRVESTVLDGRTSCEPFPWEEIFR